jgi:hypothetical protein
MDGIEGARIARGRAAPHAAVRHRGAVGQRRLALEVAAPADPGIPLQDRVRRHAGVVIQRDLSEDQAAALDARVLEVHGVADADVVAHAEQVRRAQRHRADHDVFADLRAQQAQPPAVQRGAGQQVRRRRLDQAVGQPPAVIGHAPQRIAAGLQLARDQPLAAGREHELHDRRQQEHADRRCDRARRGVAGIAGHEVVGEERRQPLRHPQRHQHRYRGQLAQSAQPALRCGRRRPVLLDVRGAGGLVEAGGDRTNLALLVDVAHRHVGEARVGAQGRGQARGKEGVAAEVAEEIELAADRLAREQLGEGGEQRFLGRRLGMSDSAASLGSGALRAIAFSALRSILPEVRRGITVMTSKRLGTM